METPWLKQRGPAVRGVSCSAGAGAGKWTRRMRPKGQGVMRNHLVGERSYFRWVVREGKIQAEGRKCKGPEAGVSWVSLGPAKWPVWPMCAK